MPKRHTNCFLSILAILFFGVFVIGSLNFALATEIEDQIVKQSITTSTYGLGTYPRQQPVVNNGDGSTHIIVGPVMVAYLKILCWAVGLMFFLLSIVAGGLGWLFKRTLDRMDLTTVTLAKSQARLSQKQDDLQSDLDGLLAEHNLRGKLCPGLRPDLLKEVVASILGISAPETQHLHRRVDDVKPATVHHHTRETNGMAEAAVGECSSCDSAEHCTTEGPCDQEDETP